MTAQQPLQSEPRNLLTVKMFADRWPAWSQAALRALIYAEKENGLSEFGVVVRLGRRVLLDEQAFFNLLASQQKRLSAAAGRRRGADAATMRVG